jgi:hypothetical protein
VGDKETGRKKCKHPESIKQRRKGERGKGKKV